MNFGSKFKGTPLRDYFASPIHTFIDLCVSKNIAKGYYPFIKVEALRNLTKAINELLGTRGVPYYARKNYVEQSSEMLITLFEEKLDPFDERFTDEEIDKGKEFFVKNEKNLKEELNLQHEKENIPEDNDIKLIICCSNMGWDCPYILSNDSHFIGYLPEIYTQFNIRVLEMEELRQIMNGWNWTC